MPTYEYLCEANGRVVEVSHKMNESLGRWADVCEQAGISLGKTAADAPVKKLISGGYVNVGASGYAAAPCETGGPCGGGGACGLE